MSKRQHIRATHPISRPHRPTFVTYYGPVVTFTTTLTPEQLALWKQIRRIARQPKRRRHL